MPGRAFTPLSGTELAASERGVLASVWGGFAALFALHLALAWPLVGPMLFGDEVVPLLTSRYLAGHGPPPRLASSGMRFVSFYHAGYALLLTPAWWLFPGPASVYRWATVLNSGALAGIFPLAAAFARRVLGLTGRHAVAVGFVVALYPAFVLQSNLTWSEAVVLPAVLATFLAFEHLARRKTVGAALLLATLATACHAVHQRLLVLLVLAALGPLALLRHGELTRRVALVAAAATTGGGLLVGLGHRLLFARLWPGAARFSELDLAARLTDEGAWRNLLLSLAGQHWYLAVASLGLVWPGLLVLARRGRQPGSAGRTALFVLVVAAALMLTSAAFVTEFDRVDKRFYGRYAETFLAPLLVAGLASLAAPGARREKPAALLIPVLAPFVLVWVLLWGHGRDSFVGPLNQLNVLGVEHWLVVLGGVRLLRLSALGAAVALAGSFLGRRFWPAALATCGALFLAGSLVTYQRWLLPTHLAVNAEIEMPGAVRALGPIATLAYDESAFTYAGFFGCQLWLDGVDIRFFQSATGELPPAPLVVSDARFGRRHPASQRLFVETRTGATLWRLPGPRVDRP